MALGRIPGCQPKEIVPDFAERRQEGNERFCEMAKTVYLTLEAAARCSGATRGMLTTAVARNEIEVAAWLEGARAMVSRPLFLRPEVERWAKWWLLEHRHGARSFAARALSMERALGLPFQPALPQIKEGALAG